MQLMQSYWENDVATTVDKALIYSTQTPREMLLHTVFSNLPPLPLVAHHTYSYKTPFSNKAPDCTVITGPQEILKKFVFTDPEV